MEAVKRPHFFAQPIDIPLIFREENTFGLTGSFSTEVYYRQSRGFAPDTAEFADAGCGHDKNSFCTKNRNGLIN